MSDAADQATRGPIPGYVVGQFFGFFNGVSRQQYARIVATAPFENCNLLVLAFVHTEETNTGYLAQFTNWRSDDHPVTPGDMDEDRVRLVVETARAKNAGLKILISLGWGYQANDTGKAAKTPAAFASSVAEIVRTHRLDGFDIDYESTAVSPPDMLTLVQHLRQSPSHVGPKREMILTITPAQTSGLDDAVLQEFTYVMPQTYDTGGSLTTAEEYSSQLGGSYDRIVYGLNSEGDDNGESDDPGKFAALAKSHNAAGFFAWRLDNDSVDPQTALPTFATARAMWRLMHPGR
jgi:Glycosyl hydrolases family 18